MSSPFTCPRDRQTCNTRSRTWPAPAPSSATSPPCGCGRGSSARSTTSSSVVTKARQGGRPPAPDGDAALLTEALDERQGRSISVVLDRAGSLEVLEQDRLDVEHQLDLITDDHA